MCMYMHGMLDVIMRWFARIPGTWFDNVLNDDRAKPEPCHVDIISSTHLKVVLRGLSTTDS